MSALAGTARAGDPPGFPSGPTAPTAPTTAPDPAGEFAKQRMAALRKFARDKQADPMWKEREDADGDCRIDREARRATVTFTADGVQHCKLGQLGEGYAVDVWILTVKDLYSVGDHYRVTAKPGEPLGAAPVHGTSDDVKAALAVLSGLHEDYATAAWWHAPKPLGPYHNDSVTITVTLDEAGVAADTKLAIAPLYSINLSVAAVVGPGFSTYALVDGKIAESKSSANLDYYFGVHVYPFSWQRNGNNRVRPGRYFSDPYNRFIDRLSLLAGVNLAHPTQGGFIGLALEVYDGISITGGWQPRKLAVLSGDNKVGDMLTGDAVPTDSHWKLSGWGVGLSVDASVLKPLVSVLH